MSNLTLRLLVLAVLIGGVSAFFAFDLDRYATLEYFAAQRAALIALRDASPGLVSLLYFVTYVTVTALSLPAAAALTLAGGALFGFWWALLLVSFASAIGGTLAFLAARIVLGDALQRRYAAQLAAFNAGIDRDGPFYLFTLRVVPLFPFFVVNLVMGLTRIPVWTFYWVSQLGMLPGTVAYVWAGTELGRLGEVGDILNPSLIGAFVLLGVFPFLARWLIERLRARRVYRGFRRPRRFDANLVVVGAGSAGLIAALVAATVRARAILIERERMGGDCLNTGCVPSKTLIRSAAVAHEVAHAAEFGVRAEPEGIDFATVMARVRQAIATIEPNDSVERYTSLGVDCVAGEARLVDPWTVEVAGRRITGRNIVIATGARPFVPPLPGLEDCEPLTSDTVWSLDTLPERLLVMGGGPIGCELAQSFARLGARVTVVDMLDRILPREDPDVSAHLTRVFEREGIEVRVGHRAERFEGDASGGVMIALHDGREERVGFDRVLVAVGRRANTDSIGASEIGIALNRDGTIEVDAFMRTRLPNILACGDVAGPYQFTHMASHQAWYAAVNGLFGFARRFRANYAVVPWVTFTDPEVGRVGLSESEARERGIQVEVTRYDLAELDRAIAEGSGEGFIKVLTRPGSDRILGAVVVSRHGGELLAQFVLAMTHGIGLNKIMGTIAAYPTWSEAVKATAAAWRRKHVPERALAFSQRLHAFLRT